MKRVRAKKYLGQHFLNNNTIAQNITNQLDTNLNKNVLEIGPGMGVLTKFLLNQILLDLERLKLKYSFAL